MSAFLALSAAFGPLAGRFLAFLGLPPDADERALARTPEAFFLWAAIAAGLPADEESSARRWFREFLLRTRAVPARGPSQVLPSGEPALGPSWSSLHPRPAPHRTWVEVMATGTVVSASVVAYALSLIFSETDALARYNRAIGFAPERVVFSFRERALASNCAAYVASFGLDQSSPAAEAREWTEPPRKRLAMARAGLASGPARGADHRLVRPPEELALEAGLRGMAASISNSWKSYASGLRCWAVFMDALFPADPHFPALPHHVAAFAAFFQNGDTFEKYLSHVHFAERLLRLDRAVSRDFEKAVVRGARKGRPRREGPAFRRPSVLLLVQAAVAAGRVDLARLIAVARAWLLRVPSEGLPLQADGRRGLPPSSTRWHSVVTVVRPAPRPCVRISWRVRKNAPAGDASERTCTCGPAAPDPLCGPCALLGQLASAAADGVPPDGLLFPALQRSAAREALRTVAAAFDLPPAWHAFRRGMAQDMLSDGRPLGEILLAGGWRSGAFLRYLSRFDLDRRVALEHAFAESGDEA